MATDKYAKKPHIFDGSDFSYWKTRMQFYIEAQGHAIWLKVKNPYVVPANDDVITPDVEAYNKARNFLIQGLSRCEFERVAHLRSAHEIWKTLCDYHEGSTAIKEVRQNQLKKEYSKIEQRPRESLDKLWGRFYKILHDLHAVDFVFTESENARQLLDALDVKVWGMKITSINDNTVMSELTMDKLYSRLKTHEIDFISCLPKTESMALVVDPSKVSSSDSLDFGSSGFSLSALHSLSDEQLEKLPEDDLTLLSTKFSRVYNKVRNRRRGGSVTCFECGEPNHIRSKCPKRKGNVEKDSRRRPQAKDAKAKKPNYRKFVSRVLAALENVDMSDVDSGTEDDEDDSHDKKKTRDFTGMCFMARDSHDVDSSNDDDIFSDPDKVCPSPSEMKRALVLAE